MRWCVLAVPLVLLMDIIMLINYNNYRQAEFDAIVQREYDIMINYAVDAAVQESMLQVMDSSVDYKDIYSINLEPDAALDTYCECMLRSLGWSVTEENKADLLNAYTPFFVVAGAEGFYIYKDVYDEMSMTMPSGDVVENIITRRGMWSPKIPYSTSTPTHIYIYSMADNFYTLYDKGTKKFLDNVEYKTVGNEPGTHADRNKVIASSLNKAMNAALFNFDENVYIPYIINLPMNDLWNIKAPTTPCVYAMIVDRNTLTKDLITAVGGARVEVSSGYIAYTRGVNKFYTYAYNREKIENDYHCVVENVYATAVQAAKDGYYPDVAFR